MTPFPIFFTIWFLGMFWQGASMLRNVPEQIKDLFRTMPVLMFSTFIFVLFIIWPAWMAWDVWNQLRRWWVGWQLRRATKALQKQMLIEGIKESIRSDPNNSEIN